MKIECPGCGYTSDIDDAKLPDREVLACCPKCQHRFPFSKIGITSPDRHNTDSIRCPKCDTEQTPAPTCRKCGVLFHKIPPSHVQETSVLRAHDDSSNRPFWKQRIGVLTMLLIAVIIAAPLITYLGNKLRVKATHERWLKEDSAERINAPSWQYDLRAFAGSQQRQDIESMFRKDGFKVRSVNDSGIRPEDKGMCWMIVKDVWGIPALHASAFFEENSGLTSVRLSFDPDQYPAVCRQLDLYGHKMQADLGKDNSSTPVDGWILDNGIATSSRSPDKLNGIVVYWVSREVVEHDISAYLQSQRSPSSADTKGLSDAFVAEVRNYWPSTDDPGYRHGQLAVTTQNKGVATPVTAAEQTGEERLLQTVPDGYGVAFQQRKGNMLMIEMVPHGQSVESWTEMVTTQVFAGGIPQRTPTAFYRASGDAWKKVCQNAEDKLLQQGTENGYPFAFWLQACPNNPVTKQQEFTFFKAIQGNDSFFLVQKAWKRMPDKEEVVEWSQYMKQIKVCDSRITGRACPTVK